MDKHVQCVIVSQVHSSTVKSETTSYHSIQFEKSKSKVTMAERHTDTGESTGIN